MRGGKGKGRKKRVERKREKRGEESPVGVTVKNGGDIGGLENNMK